MTTHTLEPRTQCSIALNYGAVNKWLIDWLIESSELQSLTRNSVNEITKLQSARVKQSKPVKTAGVDNGAAAAADRQVSETN